MVRPPLGPSARDLGKYLRTYLLALKPRMDNGDEIELVDWYDADVAYEPEGYPYGTFMRTRTAEPSPIARDWEPNVYADDPVTDTIAFDPAVSRYLLVNSDVTPPGIITEVRATVGGVPNTLVPSTNYASASATRPDYLDSIRLVGPTYPDFPSNFAVTYRSRRAQRTRIIEAYPVWRLAIHYQDLYAPAQGATRNYEKSDLAHQCGDWYLQRFILDRGQRLGPSARELNWKGPYSDGFAMIDDAQRTRVANIDVYTSRRTIIAVTDTELLRITDPTITPTL